MRIQNTVKTYEPFGNGKRFTEKKYTTVLRYLAGNKKDEEIDVLYWQRYPQYDFIFGVPTKRNKYFGVEVGFFQYRDVRYKEIRSGFYIDKIELAQMAKGFAMMLKASRKK